MTTYETAWRYFRDVIVVVTCLAVLYTLAQVHEAVNRFQEGFGGGTTGSSEPYEEPQDWENDPDCWTSDAGEPLCAPGGEDGLALAASARPANPFVGARAKVHCVNVGSLLVPTECFPYPR